MIPGRRALDLAKWGLLGLVLIAPLVAAGFSPLLAWRDATYILAGFAGILAMCLLCVQPLLMLQALPRLHPLVARRLHRLIGAMIALCVLGHVFGLWLTSPPDVVDALLFASPTPFSAWGVIAMWTVFAVAAVAPFRRKLHPRTWRLGHTGLTAIIVLGTIIHALLIEGTMEIWTKLTLCVAAFLGSAIATYWVWSKSLRARA